MSKTQKLIVFTLLWICATASMHAQEIQGFWKTINHKTQKIQSIIAVYEYEGKYYGRLIGSFNDEGKMDDNIYHPKNHAPGVQGHPFYAGLDLMWDLADIGTPYTGPKYKGKIIDPRRGKIYTVEVWRKDADLIVRGELFIFGRNETWPAADNDFPPGFKKPNLNEFVPVIPKAE